MPVHLSKLCAAAALSLVLSGCGSSDSFDWDEFRSRPATTDDLARQSFVFTGFDYGAVFDSSLSQSTTTLSFGAATRTAPTAQLPFVLAAKGANASGVADLDGNTLTLSWSQVSPPLTFVVGTASSFSVLADVDDGRISLTNRATGLEATSAPR